MSDISLLIASVLSTGQTVVPDLPEELPEERSKTQQLKQNQETSVALSSEITPPEFVESDKTLDITSLASENSYSLQSHQSVITPSKANSENQKILVQSRNKIQFQDSVSLTQEVDEQKEEGRLSRKTFIDSEAKVKSEAISPQQSNSELPQSSGSILLPSRKSKMFPNQSTIPVHPEDYQIEAAESSENYGLGVSRSRVNFQDRKQEVGEKDFISEISRTEKVNSLLNKLNQLDKKENIPKTTQKIEPSSVTEDKKLQEKNTFSSARVFASSSDKFNHKKTKNLSLTPYSGLESPMSQVTSVSELDDVSPIDWAFEALESLVHRHNCALSYSDGTFRGNQVINRYQFATGIDACLQKINELIARSGANAVDEQDLVILQRLLGEFRAELNQLENRIVPLEEKTSELQANRFSPTTRFFGQVTSSLQGTNTNEVDLFPRDGVPERTAETNLTFTNSMQITLATSFTGRDLLLTGLYSGNLGSSASSLFTNMGRLSFESDTDSDVLINDLSYRFPVSNNFGVVVGTAGVNPSSTFRGINPLEGSGEGAISAFAQRNPIIGIGSGTGGVGFDWQINNRMSLQGIYSAQFPSFPGDKNVGGLFGGRQTLGGQLTLTPVNDIDVGLHYLYSRSSDGLLATGVGDAQLTSPFAPTTSFNTQAVGATVAYRINPNLQIGGWGGWTFSDPEGIQGSVTTNNWAVFAAFPNLGRRGNLGGIIVGQPPKITSSSLPDGFNFPNFSNNGTPGGRDDTSLHLEMFYRAKLNQNLDITPGFFLVFNPDHNQSNDPLIVGALRATFRF
ncbi:MAG: iron uptake porin [Cyanobacteria bacterium P01_D01_bin.116]